VASNWIDPKSLVMTSDDDARMTGWQKLKPWLTFGIGILLVIASDLSIWGKAFAGVLVWLFSATYDKYFELHIRLIMQRQRIESLERAIEKHDELNRGPGVSD